MLGFGFLWLCWVGFVVCDVLVCVLVVGWGCLWAVLLPTFDCIGGLTFVVACLGMVLVYGCCWFADWRVCGFVSLCLWFSCEFGLLLFGFWMWVWNLFCGLRFDAVICLYVGFD